MVERGLPKPEVAGSIPVVRSEKSPAIAGLFCSRVRRYGDSFGSVSRRCHAKAELDETFPRVFAFFGVTVGLDVGGVVDLDRVAEHGRRGGDGDTRVRAGCPERMPEHV